MALLTYTREYSSGISVVYVDLLENTGLKIGARLDQRLMLSSQIIRRLVDSRQEKRHHFFLILMILKLKTQLSKESCTGLCNVGRLVTNVASVMTSFNFSPQILEKLICDNVKINKRYRSTYIKIGWLSCSKCFNRMSTA